MYNNGRLKFQTYYFLFTYQKPLLKAKKDKNHKNDDNRDDWQ